MISSATPIEKYEDIPANVLCVFAKKILRGTSYFIGYRVGETINVHFSAKTYTIEEVVSYQQVLSQSGRGVKIKK